MALPEENEWFCMIIVGSRYQDNSFLHLQETYRFYLVCSDYGRLLQVLHLSCGSRPVVF
jgi:hypothetical protein